MTTRNNWRIPSRIRLPFGFSVRVRQLSQREFEEQDHAEGNDAFWSPADHTIYLRRSASIRWKRYLVAHELGHVLKDWEHELVLSGFAAPKHEAK